MRLPGASFGVLALVLSTGLTAGCRRSPSLSKEGQDVARTEQINVSRAPAEDGYRGGTTYRLQQGEDRFELISLVPERPDFAPVLKFLVHGPNSSCAQRSAALDFRVLQSLFLVAQGKAQPVYTLYTCYHEIDDRLPALAAGSPEWIGLNQDKKISAHRPHVVLADIVNQSGALNELSRSLAPDRYRVSLASEDLEIIWARAADLRSEQRRLLPPTTPLNQVLPSSIGKTFLLTREGN